MTWGEKISPKKKKKNPDPIRQSIGEAKIQKESQRVSVGRKGPDRSPVRRSYCLPNND